MTWVLLNLWCWFRSSRVESGIRGVRASVTIHACLPEVWKLSLIPLAGQDLTLHLLFLPPIIRPESGHLSEVTHIGIVWTCQMLKQDVTWELVRLVQLPSTVRD